MKTTTITILMITILLFGCSSKKQAPKETAQPVNTALQKHLQQAQKYLQNAGEITGSINSAYNEFQQAEKIDPNHPEVCEGLGMIHYYSASYEKAQKYLHKAYAQNKKSISIVYHLGLLYQMQEQYKEAIKMFHMALSLDPQMHGIYLDLASCAAKINQKQALNYYKTYMSFSKEITVDIYFKAGLLAKELQQPQQAILYLTKAQKYPNYPVETHYHLAQLYSQQQHYKKAVAEKKCTRAKKTIVE